MFGSCHSWSPIHTTDGILVDNRKLGVDEKGEHPILINKEDQRTNHPSISKKGSLQTTVKCFPGMTTGKLEINLWEEGYSLEASTIEDVKKKKIFNNIKKNFYLFRFSLWVESLLLLVMVLVNIVQLLLIF